MKHRRRMSPSGRSRSPKWGKPHLTPFRAVLGQMVASTDGPMGYCPPPQLARASHKSPSERLRSLTWAPTPYARSDAGESPGTPIAPAIPQGSPPPTSRTRPPGSGDAGREKPAEDYRQDRSCEFQKLVAVEHGDDRSHAPKDDHVANHNPSYCRFLHFSFLAVGPPSHPRWGYHGLVGLTDLGHSTAQGIRPGDDADDDV
jgi:hypothetical protein